MNRTFMFMCIALMGLLWLTGCSSSNGELTLSEVELTENEKLLFSTVSKDTFIFELDGQLPKGEEIKIGVDYYHFGEPQEEIEITSILTDPDPDDGFSESYERMSIMLLEEESETRGDFQMTMEGGGGFSSEFVLGELNTDQKSFSSGSLLENEDMVINDESNEKHYIAQYIIAPSSRFRTFDLEHATQPNDDYETMYLFYIQVLEPEGAE
ncbi:hypothetical protein [Alkalicoccobacillus porphyridii]|uniref:Lipoprotein n=1 Tax=Alkalicoccobacillus porphyridii TaxID=2597270 RepID=A0A553ZYZ4_9BACI|nr:hypothetical protein [Alkalicoccobacillus porphyridii]TSB46658.1 hypothetical protein FN960_09890 [Alkalicoccobacillus porphyridii]